MGMFGKKSGGSKAGEEEEYKGGRSANRKKKSPDSDDDDGFAHDTNGRQKQKETRIKKMRSRMTRRANKANGDDASISSRASRQTRGGGPSLDSAPPGFLSQGGGYSDNDQSQPASEYGYGDDGGFQLDNVPGPARGMGARGASSQAMTSGGKRGKGTQADTSKKFRVKPFHSFPAPLYLNESELYLSMMAPTEEAELLTSYLNPSTKTTRRAKVPDIVRKTWGTPKEDGRIGSLKVEVLGCVGLARAKPEVAVYLVVGDCAFTTDIIQGARSPMWPDVSKRAAVFPIHHAYARLFVGVFDVKQSKNKEADHFCGRIAIDLPPLRPDTEYDVTFPLRSSSFIYDRRARGVVRLRFSLHWFSERAVVMSYLKRPRNPLAFSKQAQKQPTIPCGDPKTFRNVAVTVHGVDFPGKYSRQAFRATMREFNLYQQNLRYLFKITIMDCILYENPLMSIYLFSTCMYCVWTNSVRLVPPIFVGWIIYLFVENYLMYNTTIAGHLGYSPLTILEIFKGFMRDGNNKKFNFEPLIAKKRARRQERQGNKKQNKEEEGDIELINHREFPFSERFEYHKFSAAEAIAPSPAAKNKKGGNKGQDLRTARRLSIYVAPIEQKEEESENDEESDESDQDDKDDDGDMMEQGDDGYGDMDSDDEEEEEGGEAVKGRLLQSGKSSATRRIRVGPPQNSETSGRKVPPQVHLSRVEHLLHKASKNISVEMVFFPPAHLQFALGEGVGKSKGPLSDVISQKEKQNFDDFDRLLGFRVRNPNPILRITSSFLGPLMRIIRIVVYATRISFNLTTWRDPYLSFWVLMFLSTLTFVLLIFPWRTFFFLSTIVLLGPQNIAVRKLLERRAKEKETEEKEAKEREKEAAQAEAYGQLQTNAANAPAARDDLAKDKKKKSRWGRGRKKDEPEEEEVNEADLYQSPRPAFYAHTRPTRRTQVPREVAVPYFRFRKDRFYDWPPDPTVSRATPMLAAPRQDDDDDDNNNFDEQMQRGQDMDQGMRQRNNRKQKNQQSDADMYGYE